MAQSQDRLSLQNLFFPVEVLIPQGANPDLTEDVVEFQFVNGGLPPRNRPTTDGWVTGSWTTTDQGQNLATILVGPGGAVTLAPGRWAIWIRIMDDPSEPTGPVDQITIT